MKKVGVKALENTWKDFLISDNETIKHWPVPSVIFEKRAALRKCLKVGIVFEQPQQMKKTREFLERVEEESGVSSRRLERELYSLKIVVNDILKEELFVCIMCEALEVCTL